MQSIYANCNVEVTLEERIATFHILNGEVKENGILGERESAIYWKTESENHKRTMKSSVEVA